MARRRGDQPIDEAGRLDLIAAVGMATRNPASFLGLADQLGSIRAGQKANLILLRDAASIVEISFQ